MSTTPTPHRRGLRRPAFVAALALGTAVLTGCLSADQQTAFELVNDSRSDNGRPTLNADMKTSDKAQKWSQHMATTGVLEHTGGAGSLDPSGIDHWCAVAENVGKASSVKTVQDLFMADPPHRKNVLGTYDRVGVGVVKKGTTYWVTQIFVRTNC